MQQLLRPLRNHPLQQSHIYRSSTRLFHSNYNPSLEDQTFTLPDSRKIGFAQYGQPSGHPLFLFHGAPGSRYDAIGFHKQAQSLNINVICPDRPGHGLSIPHPTRTLSSYASDISSLATHLKISHYDVLGISGGGPYVAACAYAASSPHLPAPALRHATILAGMGPRAVIKPSIAGWYTTIALALTGSFPGLMTRLTDLFYTQKYINNNEKVKRSLIRLFKLLPKRDRETMITGLAAGGDEGWNILLASFRAAYAQGSRGTFGDSAIYWRDWDFELKDVMKKIVLVYADSDNRTPVAFGRHYQEQLRESEYIELEDASHFRMDGFEKDILRKAVGLEVEDVQVEGIEDGVRWKVKETKAEGENKAATLSVA